MSLLYCRHYHCGERCCCRRLSPCRHHSNHRCPCLSQVSPLAPLRFYLCDTFVQHCLCISVEVTSNVSSLLFSSLRGRQLLSCLVLRPQIGPNALPLTNQKTQQQRRRAIPSLKRVKERSKKLYPSCIKE